MILHGRVVYWLNGEEFESDAEAVLEKNRISVDWHEDDERGHLEATSTDGVSFRGEYGYSRPQSSRHFELKKYSAGMEVLLFGRWWNEEDGNEGRWLFVLNPNQE